jgi:pentatricopeptide repeat protein
LPTTDARLLNFVVQAINNKADLQGGVELVAAMQDSEVQPTTETYTILTRKHLRFGRTFEIVKLFDTMVQEDVSVGLETAKAVLHSVNVGKYSIRRVASVLTAVDKAVQRAGIGRDAIYYGQGLSNCARCVSRAYGATSRIDGYQGVDSIVHKCAGTHEYAAHLYAEMLESDVQCSPLQLRKMITNMLFVADKLGSSTVAKQMWEDLAAFGVDPDHNTYLHMIGALGHAGDLDSMAKVMEDLKLDASVSVSIKHITAVIYHFGRVGEHQKNVDEIYDLMLELGLKPDDELNQVLIHVCKIDPLSVSWNAA